MSHRRRDRVKSSPSSLSQTPSSAHQRAELDRAVGPGAEVDRSEFGRGLGLLQAWLHESPSWAASMAFHMVLFLVLALLSLPALLPEANEIVSMTEVESPLDVIDPDVQTEVPIDLVTEHPTDPVEIDKPQPESKDESMLAAFSPTQSTDVQEAAPELLELDNSILTRLSSKGDRSGSAKSGLGDRGTGPGRGSLSRTWSEPPEAGGAMNQGLEWLAAHQNYDGSWSFDHTPGDRCSGFENPGTKTSKMGATGLALLAFLGAGHTHKALNRGPGKKPGKYRPVVSKAIKYLVSHMVVEDNAGMLFEENGDSNSHMYCHGIAACALAEAYGMSQDKDLRKPAQWALNYIVNAQHDNGGWLYEPRQGGDTSVCGWQIMAFKSGKMAYLEVPKEAYGKAQRWFDLVQSDGGAAYGYRRVGDRPSAGATSAIGLLCRNYLGWKQDHPGLAGGVRSLGALGPKPNDMYYNYYATMFMFQNNGAKAPAWRTWNKQMMTQLLGAQVSQGRDKGSWHFPGGGHNMSEAGGRVYNTALATMTLQVYYRYERIYQ